MRKENKNKNKNKKGHMLFFYVNKLYIMSYSRKIKIPYPGSVARVVHSASTSGSAHGSANPTGNIPNVVVKVLAENSSLKRKKTKGGKSYRKKHTMRKAKKSRKQTKKKGKKNRKSSKKSKKTRK